MGLFSSNSKNRWSPPRSISVSSISYSHTPRGAGSIAKGHSNDPIYVKKTLFGYKVHDGNSRVQAAKAKGQRTIRAHIKED